MQSSVVVDQFDRQLETDARALYALTKTVVPGIHNRCLFLARDDVQAADTDDDFARQVHAIPL